MKKNGSSVNTSTCIYLFCQLQRDPAEKTGSDSPAQTSGRPPSGAKPGRSPAELTEPESPKSCWNSPPIWRRTRRGCCQTSSRWSRTHESDTGGGTTPPSSVHHLYKTRVLSLKDATAHVDIPDYFVLLTFWNPGVRVLTCRRKQALQQLQTSCSSQQKGFIVSAFFLDYFQVLILKMLDSIMLKHRKNSIYH